MPHKPELICLWGKKRDPTREPKDIPTSADKGVRELIKRGYVVKNVYPGIVRSRLLGLVGGRLADMAGFGLASLLLLCFALDKNRVVYTTDYSWVVITSKLKQLGLVKNRLVVKWAGIDTDLPHDVVRNERRRKRYMRIAEAMQACWTASAIVQQHWREFAPHVADRFVFWPTAVELGFYERREGSDTSSAGRVVAVGSDRKRDWALPIAAAEHGLPVTLLTDDARVPELVEKAGAGKDLKLQYKAGFDRSADILAGCGAILLATAENMRFSGSTTVGVAAALRKPLILDEEYDLAAYGLEHGRNCLYFPRGDAAKAAELGRMVLEDEGLAQRLGAELNRLAPYFSIEGYADQIERSFYPDWRPEAVRWPPTA